MKLLIADDEQFIRKGLMSLDWKSIGIEETVMAQNGTEAKEIIKSQPVDIALLDINMPGMSGLDLAEMIQRDSMDMAVILLTGFSEFEYAQRALRAGVTDYLVKPFGPKEILTTVSRIGNDLSQKREQQRIVSEYSGKTHSMDAVRQVSRFFAGADGVANDILKEIAEGYTGPISVADLAEKYHFSENYLSRKIRQETGYSFTDIVLALRLMNAVRCLSEGEKINSAAEKSGFNDQRYFSQVFRRTFHCSPSEWKSEKAGQVLHFHEVLEELGGAE